MDTAPRSFRLSALLRILVVAALFVAAAVLYPRLPATIPTHWNFRGQADGFSSRAFGAFLLPGLSLLFLILFPVLRRLDPRSENYAAFRATWEWMQLLILCFLGYVFAVQMVATLHPAQSAMVGRYIVVGVGILFVLLGNVMGKIRQNYFVGLKTPWGLDDPEVWQKSQRFGGVAFVLGGIAVAVQALIGEPSPGIFFGIILLMIVLPMLYSYLVFKRRSPGVILAIVAALIVILALLIPRFARAESLSSSQASSSAMRSSFSSSMYVRMSRSSSSSSAAPSPSTIPCDDRTMKAQVDVLKSSADSDAKVAIIRSVTDQKRDTDRTAADRKKVSSAASKAFLTALDAATAARRSAVDKARTDRRTAVDTAFDAWKQHCTMAALDRAAATQDFTNAMKAAETAYRTAVQTAEADYRTAVKKAEMELRSARLQEEIAKKAKKRS